MAAKTENRNKSNTGTKTKRTAPAGTSAQGQRQGQGQTQTQTRTRSQGRGKTAPAKSAERPAAVHNVHRKGGMGNPQLMKEAGVWLILAFCVFSFISYFGIGGYIGTVISDISFGLFGFPAYILPALAFLAAAFLISNRGSHAAAIKFLSGLMLYLCICSIMELLVNGYQPDVRIEKLYADSAALKAGGGAVGGILCSLICPAFGAIGAGVILGILVIISLVLLTQKSLLAGMKHQGERMYRSARISREKRELRLQEREEAEERELEQLRRQRAEEERRSRTKNEQNVHLQDTEKYTPFSAKNRQTDVKADHTGKESSHVQPLLGKRKKRGGRNPEKNSPYSHTQEGWSSSASGRTQIDVPVFVSSRPGTSRLEHKVTGVTMNTKLGGNPLQDTGVRESVPGTLKKRARVSSFPVPNKETEYIELETEEIVEDRESFREVPQWTGPELPDAWPDENVSEADEKVPEEPHDEPEEGFRGFETPPEDAVREITADEIDPEEYLEEDPEENDREEKDQAEAYPEQFRMMSYGEEDEMKEDSEEGAETETGEIQQVGSERTENDADKMPDRRKAAASPAGPPKKNPRSSEAEIQEGIATVEAEIEKAAEAVKPEYVFPPIDLLKKGKTQKGSGQEQEIKKTAAKLQQTLKSFGVNVTVINASCGPTVTRYELQPEQGVKVSRIVSLADDIKLNLAAADIRIEAPIPGKAAVGIEVPNAENSAVMLRDLFESEEFRNHPSKMAFATGKDIAGRTVVSDIAKMPHLLIAGATGSGKSVCINTLIMSILYKAKPDEVKLIMIDPKVVELSVYNGIPHLFIPVVTDPKKAAGALNWGVAEMTDRYNKFAEMGVRDLKGYNQKIEAVKDIEDENKPQKLPQIIIIVDELADLMMVAPGEVEDSICRLAQLARAAGIHLVIATQRPSVNVITGLIKANMPSRIAFSVSSSIDSRTILDMSGAEKLLGKGDMLFYPQGYQKPARLQGAFVSDEEVSDVVDFLKNKNMTQNYSAEMEAQIAKIQQASSSRGSEDVDALFAEAGRFIIEKDKASIGMLQRVFKIGFNRAARIMDQLTEAGVVGPEEGTKPRKVLMSQEQFENRMESGG